ncbi:hypothetical protein ACH79_33950 [Bradyrhizobium sp. CCBAU 051011]|uniref:hypothetical protein n=1 Tax=Bradyrhizobium sp. CCBAU 051011 TaxID=858422 RepID=UPI001373D153|nr:hypothetical protein [Bradyrhizobium sp. CCBAU 051011]QHO76899.1 hypothetical protein ACH79_33950 [Bradyrhizobium sp. CCBAU 051011]
MILSAHVRLGNQTTSRRVQRTNCFAFTERESRQSLGNDMSLGMSMDVVELVIYGLLALWGPPLLFAAYLLRPIK